MIRHPRGEGDREGCGERAGTQQPGNVLTTSQEGSHFPRGQRPVTSRPANLTEASCLARWACPPGRRVRAENHRLLFAPRDAGQGEDN